VLRRIMVPTELEDVLLYEGRTTGRPRGLADPREKAGRLA
jgi:hypothetical protein